ncbi:NAD(+) synthase, partial [Streptomyces sp. NPDC005904]
MPTIRYEREVRGPIRPRRPRPLPTRSHSGRPRHAAHTLCRHRNRHGRRGSRLGSGFFTKFGDGAADVVPLTGL